MIYENGSLKRILVEGGYIEDGVYHFYIQDHLGNNRVVAKQDGTPIQTNHYYPFGMSFAESTYPDKQPNKFNGKELDMENGLNWYDNIMRQLNPVIPRFTGLDPLAEKYYSISPYVNVANNPINTFDLRGDSLSLANGNLQKILTAIYHGLSDGRNIKMSFNNGILDPSSIAEQAQNTTDFFLQDIYEIAINPTMVELSISNNNTYMLNGQKVVEEFTSTPYDYDIRMESPEVQRQLMSFGDVPGKTIQGNLGQTLIPGNISASGKSSVNSNVQVIINGKGTLNHRTVGVAHEFGHVILYLRGLPYGHTQPGVDEFIYNRSEIIKKRLDYDF